MSALTLVTANAVGWATVQLGLARIFVLLDLSRFKELPLYGTSDAEVRLCRALRVHRWKTWLPDGAVWVGSDFRKNRLTRSDAAYLRRFEMETRRAELAHWAMLCTLPLFFTWNSRRVWPVLAIYAILSNAPCILAQRYNRHILRRLIPWSTSRSVPFDRGRLGSGRTTVSPLED